MSDGRQPEIGSTTAPPRSSVASPGRFIRNDGGNVDIDCNSPAGQGDLRAGLRSGSRPRVGRVDSPEQLAGRRRLSRVYLVAVVFFVHELAPEPG
jgi:hypothetical protein